MTEPIIICPSCSAEIKLTESLAAPLIQAMRQEYEQKITQKQEVSTREAALRDGYKMIARAETCTGCLFLWARLRAG